MVADEKQCAAFRAFLPWVWCVLCADIDEKERLLTVVG